MPLIHALLEGGANMNQVNKDGMSVLHVAAQGNMAAVLFFFVAVKGMAIDGRDYE
jgi:ankyrin repeat protein